MKTSVQIVEYLSKDLNISEKKLKKAAFCLDILAINLSKIMLFFFLSLLSGTFMYTSISYFSFLVLRRYIYGYHTSSNLKCTILSVINFWVLPFILFSFNMNLKTSLKLLVYTIMALLILIYGCKGTKLNPVNDNGRFKLKLKAIIILVFSAILAFSVKSSQVNNCLMLGNTLAIFNILPIANRLYVKYGR